MTRAFLLAATAVCLGGALLVGCGEETVGSPRPIGAADSNERPREIRIDGRNPCSLVPASDLPTYQIEEPGREERSRVFKSPECHYSSKPAFFFVTLVITEGIEAWTDGERDSNLADAEPIEGFPAVTLRLRADPHTCAVLVDVADGQYLLVTVAVAPGKESEVPEKCEYAHQLARSAMKGLVVS